MSEKRGARPNVYTSKLVHIGDWHDAVRAEEELQNVYLGIHRAKGLLNSHVHSLISNTAHQVPFPSAGPNVKYGQLVQVQLSESRLTLGCSFSIYDVEKCDNYGEGSLLTLSQCNIPSVKNIFRVDPPEGSPVKEGDELKYGEHFTLVTVNPKGGNYHVKPEPPIPGNPANSMNRGTIYLQRRFDRYCKLYVIAADPRLRLKKKMKPVIAGDDFILKQAVTDVCLAGALTMWVETFVGPEALVALECFLDRYKDEASPCIWKFLDGGKSVPRDAGIRGRHGEIIAFERRTTGLKVKGRAMGRAELVRSGFSPGEPTEATNEVWTPGPFEFANGIE